MRCSTTLREATLIVLFGGDVLLRALEAPLLALFAAPLLLLCDDDVLRDRGAAMGARLLGAASARSA